MEFLRSESEAGKPVSTNQIINYLKGHNISCERRTLYKDMELLIESGANIVKTELGRENAYYIDEVSLSLAELKILIDAVQATNFITDVKTAELVEKLLAFSGIRRSEIVRDNIVLYNNHKHSNGDIYDNIEQIELAIRQKKQVSFYYFDLDEKKKSMGFIEFEEEAFNYLDAQLENFVKRMDRIRERSEDKTMNKWLDTQDVCQTLNICPRTVQTLRDNGTLAYTQISHKTYYKPEDVMAIVAVVEDRKKDMRFRKRTG